MSVAILNKVASDNTSLQIMHYDRMVLVRCEIPLETQLRLLISKVTASQRYKENLVIEKVN